MRTATAGGSPSAVGIEGLLCKKLYDDGLLPWSAGRHGTFSSESVVAAALADTCKRKLVLDEIVASLLPVRAELISILEKPLTEALIEHSNVSASRVSTGCSALANATIKHRADCGRSLVADIQMELGDCVLSDFPLEAVELQPPQGDLLTPPTVLALRLWRADVLGEGQVQQAAANLMDHGGGSVAVRRDHAVVAVACALSLGDALGFADARSAASVLFSWLGRVRIHAVAVTMATRGQGQTSIKPVALAVYPTMAANHSCQPNALLRFGSHHKLEILVSSRRGVKAGEEITISHGPIAATMPREERLARLLWEYGFHCNCPACCDNQLEDFSWRRRAGSLDAQAHQEASRGNRSGAAEAWSATIDALRLGYSLGPAVDLAREEVQIGKKLLYVGAVTATRDCWEAALLTLQLLVAPSDPDLVDVQEMLKRLDRIKASSDTAPVAIDQPSGMAMSSECTLNEMD